MSEVTLTIVQLCRSLHRGRACEIMEVKITCLGHKPAKVNCALQRFECIVGGGGGAEEGCHMCIAFQACVRIALH